MSNSNFLALAVDNTIPIRLDLCTGLQQQVGSGTVFEAVAFNTGTGDTPSWTIVGTVKKSGLVTPSRGAALYDVCLGTANISLTPFPGGTPTCNPNPANPPPPPYSTSYSWPKKGGGCAVYDGAGKFWGNVPDAPNKVKNCSQALSPVVLSKKKNGPGDLQITFCVPYPWDGGGGYH